jgi:hypothetical protein
MMRQTLLAVRGDTFDVLSVRGEIEEIARAFGEYLARTGAGGSSKHKALGPVGKALQHARAVRGEALLGYARRVHEQVTGTVYSGGAVEKLDEGLRMLDTLLERKDVPPRAHSDILSRIDYATYYDVRRRGMEFLRGWEAFVRAHGERLGLSADPTAPRFKAANAGELGDPGKKAAEEYLAQVRLAPGVAANDDEEDK